VKVRALVACAALIVACGDNGPGPSGSGTGHITYALVDGNLYRLEARVGAAPQNVSTALDALSAGTDEWISVSADGDWLLISSERFHADCVGWPCLAVMEGDLSAGEAVLVNGAPVHATAFSTIASGGNTIVYEDAGITHSRDIWVVTRTSSTAAWSTPMELSTASLFDFNSHPALSADGSTVLFDCGPQPYGAEGTAICEVGVNGIGFRVVTRPVDSPPGMPDVGALHHAAYAPDGSILFEADWAGEQIWRLGPSATVPVQLSPTQTNDNSPCVLPDGRIVSLWLSRAGNSNGLHEMKVMAASGAQFSMLLTNVDVADIGIACGG
jgi:hypothetical protein